MTTIRQFILLAISALMLGSGCSHSRKMSLTEVVGVASRAATDAGYKLSNYKDPEVSYESLRKDGTWTVFFDGKPPGLPGRHFLVWVNDRNGQTKLMPGE